MPFYPDHKQLQIFYFKAFQLLNVFTFVTKCEMKIDGIALET